MVKADSEATIEELSMVLLHEIAGKLGFMVKHMEMAEQGGMLHKLNRTITAAIFEHTCSPYWYSCTIFNDGPNPVYIDVNRDDNARNLVTPLNATENLVVDYEQPKIRLLFMRCAPGQTASVRVFATW